MAEGVGLLPTNRKALKIKGQFRRYVYKITVKCDKRQAQTLHSELARFPKTGMGVNKI